MTEHRPRPQYGEYASTEERLAAGGAELEPSPPRADTRIDPAYLVTPAGSPGAKPSFDPAVTAGLLGFGLVFIITSVVPETLNLSASLQQAYTMLKIGDLADTALADRVGIAALVATVVIYIASVVVSYRRVRAGKRAFFVPLAGGVLATIIVLVLVSAVVNNDPAMIDWIDKQRG